MNNDLKKRIKEFNKIKFNKDKGRRIIIATLNTGIDKPVTQGCK